MTILKLSDIDSPSSAVRKSLLSWIRASTAAEGFCVPDNNKRGDFPWGTKGDLNRVGDKLRAGEELSVEDAQKLDVWRASHFHVMNAFQAMLRKRTKSLPITVAQRHKRRITIIDKLSREPSMLLARMDDVAGIRLIFPTLLEMIEFRGKFLKARHNHTKKNHDDKYNYIKTPRSTGYRGVHDIYSYNSGSTNHLKYNGTMIEVQYRTIHTHAWATANEVITMTTGQRTKFNNADRNYLEFFRLSSEIFARAFDDRTSVYPDETDSSIISKFDALDKILHITQRLKLLNIARADIENFDGGVVLRFESDGSLYIHPVPRFQNSIEYYFRIEKENPSSDVVLVNSAEAGHIRSAYRNYFSDTTEFLDFLSSGRKKLLGTGDAISYARG